jgi:hypothetical protein
VQTVFKWIDQFFHSIPEGLARNIRFGLIGLWIVIAGAVSYRACMTGRSEAPQDGQDLQLSRIKEGIVREENRNRASEIQLPDPDQILPERSAIDDLPLPEPNRDAPQSLPGSADLRERDPNPASETLPPFLGESDEIIFPRREEIQDRNTERPMERDSEPEMIGPAGEPNLESRNPLTQERSSNRRSPWVNDPRTRPGPDGSNENPILTDSPGDTEIPDVSPDSPGRPDLGEPEMIPEGTGP